MFLPDEKARQSLAIRLGLDFNEKMQDWEYEVSSCDRISDFISEYDKIDLTSKEKETLMEIILDSANELLINNRRSDFEKYFSEIKNRLNTNAHLHRDTLEYWTKNDFDLSIILKTMK